MFLFFFSTKLLCSLVKLEFKQQSLLHFYKTRHNRFADIKIRKPNSLLYKYSIHEFIQWKLRLSIFYCFFFKFKLSSSSLGTNKTNHEIKWSLPSVTNLSAVVAVCRDQEVKSAKILSFLLLRFTHKICSLSHDMYKSEV